MSAHKSQNGIGSPGARDSSKASEVSTRKELNSGPQEHQALLHTELLLSSPRPAFVKCHDDGWP